MRNQASKEGTTQWATVSWEEGSRCCLCHFLFWWGHCSAALLEPAVNPLALFGDDATHTRPLPEMRMCLSIDQTTWVIFRLSKILQPKMSPYGARFWTLVQPTGKGNITFSCVWHTARLFSWDWLLATCLYMERSQQWGGKKVTKSEGVGESLRILFFFFFFWGIIVLYSVVLASACTTKWSVLTMYTYISSLLGLLPPPSYPSKDYPLAQSWALCVELCWAAPVWLSVLHTVVYKCQF